MPQDIRTCPHCKKKFDYDLEGEKIKGESKPSCATCYRKAGESKDSAISSLSARDADILRRTVDAVMSGGEDTEEDKVCNVRLNKSPKQVKNGLKWEVQTPDGKTWMSCSTIEEARTLAAKFGARILL